MADSLVIVAVPDENDHVWNISSEKVPHLTLLFLGDDVEQVDNVGQIVSFVEHAADTMLRRFHLTVDRRGELGDDKADVLFFKKNGFDAKAIRDFRAALLQDANIRKAYDATPQFDGPWKPHLTLGYPDTPAKSEDQSNGMLYSVLFNKIQVWVGNYDGPEFLLKDWDEVEEMLEAVPMDVAMSDIKQVSADGAEFLSHISEEPWSNFTAADYTTEQWHRACLVHLHDGAPTSKSECKLPVRTPAGALNRNGVHAAAAAMAGARGGLKGLSDDQKQKATAALARCYSQLDEKVPDSLAQTTNLGVEFLSHYGVKGMRWGVRREGPPTPVTPTATSRVPAGKHRKTKIETDGGENHPAHEDAIKVARAQAKLKKSGPAALSNQELRELQDRLNLERNVATLASATGRVGRGRQFVRSLTDVNKQLNDTVNTGLQTHRTAQQFR